MSNLLRKRRPTVNEAQIEPSSCTRPTHHTIRKLTYYPSKEAAAHRWDKDASRHCQGINRRFPPSQIVFGVHRCPCQTLRSPFPSNRAAISLTYSSQEFKDVEDKLDDLIPWLVKLKGSTTTARADDNPEDAERRRQLTRFVSYIPTFSIQANNLWQIPGRHREAISGIVGEREGGQDPG